jgi:hypothetical protein
MRVYEIRVDINRYQVLSPVIDEELSRLRTDGTPLSSTWTPPAVFIADDGALPGDFLSLVGSSLVTTPRGTNALKHILAGAGELRSFPFNGVNYTLTNVTNIIDCLDVTKSVTYPYVEKYVFDPCKLRESRSSLFRIPQTRHVEILCIEGLLRPEDDFLRVTREHNLLGLKAVLLWSLDET